jgi:hypothetical protein
MNNFISYSQKKAFQDSMDWFKGKSTPETHGFLPLNIGVSG